jgi:hypothetical protein
MNKNNFLMIGDVHLPYENPHALRFLKELKKDFEIPDANIYSVGDIMDLYGFSRWPKSPDAKHTINQELELVREKIRKWSIAFPEMKIAESNHDQRVMRKALGADLPSQVIKGIEEIFEFPKGWEIRDQFIVMANRVEFLVCHGEEFPCALQAAIHYGVNVVQGHHHQKSGIQHARSRMQQLWGMETGCLVDRSSFAFEYGSKSKRKPINSSGLILNGIPHIIPLDFK